MTADLRQGELAQDNDEIITECQERFAFAQNAEDSNRKEYEFDKRFVSGEQWEPTIRDERFSDRRPCLTVNITDAICRRIVNACRENRPRIVVHPVGNGADVQTAKVLDGLIRHIEYASSAAYAYDTAVENSIHGGWGWLGVDADYVSEDSFDQDLKIRGWSNPLMCYGDPNSRLPDGSDMEWFIETTYIKRTEYRAKYGYIDENGWRYVGSGDDVPDWSNKEEIRVAKYWRVQIEPATLYRYLQESGGQQALGQGFELPRGARVLQSRKVYRRVIRQYLLTAFKILSTVQWPGKWIPRVPVYGRRLDLNGRMQLKGMVRDLRDPARIYNYAQTAKTEQYALQPKAPWLGAEGFMDGHENAWRDANRKPIVALEYKPVRLEDGTYAPAPEKQLPPQPNQGFAEWGDSTKSDFLAVAGMAHDPGQDKEGEVVSGVAIKRREGLADVSNFDFYDNLTRSLRHLGRIIIDLVPHYYDTPRIVRIIREDGTAEQTAINQPELDPMTQAVMRVKNDLTVGDYEVVVDTGPDYKTKREQSAEALTELVTSGNKMAEMLASTAADKVIRTYDFPDSDAIADRLMAAIPAAQAEKNLANASADQLKSMVAGLQQQLQQANHQLLAAHLEIEAKHGLEAMKQQGENKRLEFKEKAQTVREAMKVKAQVHDTHVDAVTRHDVAEIGAAAKLMDTAASHKHESAMFERQAEHEMEMGERGFLHDLAMGAQAGNQQAAESDKAMAHEEHMAERGEKHDKAMAKAAPKKPK